MRSFASFLFLAVMLCLMGCQQLSSPLAQGAFNTAAEGITTDLLAKDPTQLPAIQALATALPTAFKGSLTSENIGATVKLLGQAKGVPSNSSVTIAATLDGAVRNYVKQNGGDVPTLQGAIVQQILTNFADGMQHGIVVFTSSR